MNIFKKIYASVYDPEFYKEVRAQSIGSVLKYYSKLALLLAFAALVVASFTVAPQAYQGVKSFGKEALAYYPKDLEIKVVKGEVSVNAPESYTLALPEEIKKEFNNPKAQSEGAPMIENLAIIDTKIDHIISFDEFRQMKTAFFLGKNYAVHYDKNTSIVFQDISKVPDGAFNHALLEKILGYADYLPYTIPVLCFVGVFIFVLFSLVWVIILGFIFFLIQKIAGRGLTYAESYKVTAYALSAPIIVGLIASLFTIPARFHILDIATLIIAFVNTPKSSV